MLPPKLSAPRCRNASPRTPALVEQCLHRTCRGSAGRYTIGGGSRPPPATPPCPPPPSSPLSVSSSTSGPPAPLPAAATPGLASRGAWKCVEGMQVNVLARALLPKAQLASARHQHAPLLLSLQVLRGICTAPMRRETPLCTRPSVPRLEPPSDPSRYSRDTAPMQPLMMLRPTFAVCCRPHSPAPPVGPRPVQRGNPGAPQRRSWRCPGPCCPRPLASVHCAHVRQDGERRADGRAAKASTRRVGKIARQTDGRTGGMAAPGCVRVIARA